MPRVLGAGGGLRLGERGHLPGSGGRRGIDDGFGGARVWPGTSRRLFLRPPVAYGWFGVSFFFAGGCNMTF